MTPYVTVAICTWNRRALLAKTLAGLERLAVSPDTRWELIVVDNGSSDGTAELIAEWCGRGTLPMRRAHEPSLGLSNARNRAIREARGEWLLFTDDDVIVDANWLEAFVAASRRHPAAGAIGGRVDPWFMQPPDQTMYQAFPALAKGFCGINLGPIEGVVPSGTHLVGANFAIRLDPAAARWFNPQLGPYGSDPVGGDEAGYQIELRKAGLEIVWCPAMCVRHCVDPQRMTLAYLRRFYTNVGRHEVMLHGVPQGAQLAGVPRWLFQLYLRHLLSRAAKALAGNRVAALRALRQQWQIGGMIAECRAQSAGGR